MLERFGKILLGTAVVAILAGSLFGQQAPQKNWKPGEYELYQAAFNEKDLNAKITKLNDWRDKFKESDYADIRQGLYLVTYQQVNKPADVMRVGSEILAQNPKDIRALYTMSLTALAAPELTGDAEAAAVKAARTLADNVDSVKPAGVADAAWDKEKPNLQALGHTVVGKLAMAKKDDETADKEFTDSLKINGNNAQVSYWAGTVNRRQKSVDRQSVALFHFARAAAFTGPGALTDAGRKDMAAYLDKAYVGFHGDRTGLPELLEQAKTQALPPAGFKIETAAEIANRKEEEFRKTNPMLALWMSVRKELVATDGVAYFAEKVKGMALPGGALGVQKFKGKVISQKPAVGAKEVVIGIADANIPEVTLKLDAPLAGKAPVGTEIEFEGVASAFSKDPFMVTFDVEKAKVTGWPAPAPVRRPGAKKAAAKKR